MSKETRYFKLPSGTYLFLRPSQLAVAPAMCLQTCVLISQPMPCNGLQPYPLAIMILIQQEKEKARQESATKNSTVVDIRTTSWYNIGPPSFYPHLTSTKKNLMVKQH